MKTTPLFSLALAASLSLISLSACNKPALPPMVASAVTDLVKTDVKIGEGALAVAGLTVAVHYSGWLYDEAAPAHKGKPFDSSRERGSPLEFPLGAGRVIRGWDEGVAGMKVGGQRTLLIPPALGYGASGAGGVIPPNATLIFDVELMAIR
jgi:FKBP-type peptidyl-prolyl cis-trans isomerase